MYGIVNVAIKEFALENFGEEKWEIILEESGVDVDFTVTDNPFNDGIVYKLAQAAAEEMKLPFAEVLESFGETVILTTNKKYNSFMDSRGSTLKDYLINLPNFHNRIMLIYPELTPPDFRISNIKDKSLHVHYISKTRGIRKFIKGYLRGLIKVFNEPATVAFLESKEDGNQQEIFKISW